MNLLQAIKDAAAKAGMTPEAESLTQLAEKYPILSEAELPDDVRVAFDGLMGFEQAKNNIKVKNHFFAQALDSIDKQILTSAKEAGLTEEQITQIEAERATGKRQQLLTQFLKEKKSDGSEEAKKQIRELQEKLQKTEAEKTAEAEKVRAEWNAEREESALQTHWNGYKWADHFPEDVRPVLGKTTLEAELAKVGAKRVYNAETKQFELRNAADTELAYSENNKPISFKEFTDKLMAEKGYLKTDAGNGGSQGTQQQTTITGKSQEADTKRINNPAFAAVNRALQGVEIPK